MSLRFREALHFPHCRYEISSGDADTKLRILAEMIGVNADLPREILALFKANDRESAAAP